MIISDRFRGAGKPGQPYDWHYCSIVAVPFQFTYQFDSIEGIVFAEIELKDWRVLLVELDKITNENSDILEKLSNVSAPWSACTIGTCKSKAHLLNDAAVQIAEVIYAESYTGGTDAIVSILDEHFGLPWVCVLVVELALRGKRRFRIESIGEVENFS